MSVGAVRRSHDATTKKHVDWKIISVLVVALVVGYVFGAQQHAIKVAVLTMLGVPASNAILDTTQLQETYRGLVANYDGTLDTAALIDGASRGMVAAAGDKYTVFLDQKETLAFNQSMNGSIGGGVGVQLGTRSDLLTIVRVLKNTPAEKAGLEAGDVVVAVNDTATEHMTTDKAVELIRGEIGTTVRLEVRRKEELHELRITRQEITTPSVESEIRDGIGMLTISRFDEHTARLARQAANEFVTQQVTGVVVDVRGNPGGYLDAAVDTAGIWLTDQIVVSERARNKVVDERRTGKNAILGGTPTVVVADGNSASASEILAGALKDHKAATIIGETTFGKGTVQRIISLDGGATLKVTVARWYTPKGVNLSEQGIIPDISVELHAEEMAGGNDTQLTAAFAHLRS